jgi:hypothetical protein
MSLNFSDSGKCLIVPDNYEQNAITDSIEESIEATLPLIPELAAATTPEARCAVLNKTIANSRVAFISRFGSAFGCDPVAEVHYPKIIVAPAASVSSPNSVAVEV